MLEEIFGLQCARVETERGLRTNMSPVISEELGYSGKRAAEIVGITYRQLDYWARTDLVRPSLADAAGSGSRRSYSYRDLLELRAVKSLLDAGIKLASVRHAFCYLRQELHQDVASVSLVINGASVLVVSSDDEIIDLLQQGQGVLNILPLAGVKQQVDAAIVEFRGAQEPAADVANVVAIGS